MNDLTLSAATAEMPEAQSEDARVKLSENLEAQSDETLRELLKEASAILEGRATARRREAIADIQRLAKENGLTVSVKKPVRKRGRPAKNAAPTQS